ncbi:MAG: hypothetical protein AB3N16_14920 [Flavobacteriaceae bacterium]
MLTALAAVLVAILIAFYYSYAQSKTEINFLEQEKSILVQDLKLMQGEVDRLTSLSKVNEIELQDSRDEIQQLLDSVGKLTFTIEKLREYRTELRRLEVKNDSLKLRNNFLNYNYTVLSEEHQSTQLQLDELREKSMNLAAAEAQQRQTVKELNQKLKTKSYLTIRNARGTGHRLRGETPIRTNKASVVEVLKGCFTIIADPSDEIKERVLYLQFLDPNKQIIEDMNNSVSVNGNVYSKRTEITMSGKDEYPCDWIVVPEGSLIDGVYTLNIFEDERLLTSVEFTLK